MRRKPQEFRFEEAAAVERAKIESLMGQEVPITLGYWLGPRPKLIAIDGDFALLQFPNGARMERVLLRDLEDSIHIRKVLQDALTATFETARSEIRSFEEPAGFELEATQ